jgi:hypothetical protein
MMLNEMCGVEKVSNYIARVSIREIVGCENVKKKKKKYVDPEFNVAVTLHVVNG